MSFIVDLIRKPPKLDDIVFVTRAFLIRPHDIPGILRREAARRRAGEDVRKPDPLGMRILIESWEAAFAKDALLAPPGAGAPLAIRAPVEDGHAAITALQTASAVTFLGMEGDERLPYLSLEAARLGLPQRADDPARLIAARRALVETLEVGEDLRAALGALALDPVEAA